MAELKVGVIGCGAHAQGHFSMIASEPRMTLTAVAETDSERLEAAKTKHRPESGFGDYREMLDKTDLDVVYVETRTWHQTPIVLECLGRDLHTSVEKPPGMNVGETVEMRDAARKSKGKAMVSFNRRYRPEVLAVRRLLQDRGGATHVSADYHKPVSGLAVPGIKEFHPPEIVCDAIHHVDLLRWLAGRSGPETARAVEVFAHSWHGDREGTPRYNAIIHFDNDCHGTMISQYGVGTRIQTAEAHGESVSAYLDLTSSSDAKVTLYVDSQRVEEPLDLEAVGGADFNETRHFADCILNDTIPWSSLDDAVKSEELSEAILEEHRGTLETRAD